MIAFGADGVSAGVVFGLFFGEALWAGMCARRRSHFLCLAKESNQRKATPLAATLRFAAGNLRCSRPGCAAELTARLQRSAQTAAASQSTMRMHPAVHSRTPPTALLGASRGEGETARAIAAPGPGLIGAAAARGGDLLPLPRAGRGRSATAAGPHPRLPPAGEGAIPAANHRTRALREHKAERSNGRRADFTSPLAVPRSAGCGAGVAAQHAALRALTRCGCLSGESEANKASSAAPPRTRASQVAPQGTRPVGSPFLWLLSFGETKESDCAAGRTSRPAAHPETQAPIKADAIPARKPNNLAPNHAIAGHPSHAHWIPASVGTTTEADAEVRA